jgi:glycosyltransferase involved in cell wall biosynthesis
MRACDYDIVHTHLFPADVVGRIAAVLARRPHIIKTLHNMGAWKKKRHLLIDSILGLFTDRVVCVSDYQRDVVIRQEKLSPSRVVTIRNGVDVMMFQRSIDRKYAASHYGIDPAKLTVGTVGRLIEEKGQIYLLQAIPLILKEYPDTQFLIVGDGDLKEQLLNYLRDKTYRNLVHIIGLREEVPQLLSLMDVFVFPSVSEAGPIAPLEAMAARCPVACSSIPPLREIVVDGVTGLHFKPENHQSLAEVVNRLLGDSDLRNQLTENAYKAVEFNLTETHIIRALEKLYFQIYVGTMQRN